MKSEGNGYEKAGSCIHERIAVQKIEIGSKLPSERELSAAMQHIV